MIHAEQPFVLLDDARGEGAGPARFYERPVEIVETRDPEQVEACLDRLREAGGRGLHAAGFLSYEAGYSLEARLKPVRAAPPRSLPPLLWFGLFEDVRELAPGELRFARQDRHGDIGAPAPLVDQSEYEAAVERVQRHIEAGDIYQANLTFQASVRAAGPPLGLYARLRERAKAGHGAVVHTGDHWLLSLSPELFFEVTGRKVTTRPMKGTARRRDSRAEDAAAMEALQTDAKQRAENLMIVDLLRNDLSRVSVPGSVKVPSLFSIETYPTIHQMTSTVTSELEEGVGPIEVIRALFPCGSITGAPKIRAMEIIAGIEREPRGVYTGSIGRVDPDGEASFNVAIRTLTMEVGSSEARLGLGSGIVADSRPADEWRECLAKGAFVADQGRFDLFETMRFDPHDGLAELERHLGRMKASTEALDFAFDRHEARNELQAATFRLREERKVRLMLARSGAIAIEIRSLPAMPAEPVEVTVVKRQVGTDDVRLRHKTSDRAFYEGARAASGSFEVLFEDEEGFLTEGSFTTLFVERGGKLVTPPLSRGLLPGILRQRLIEEGRAEEGEVRREDLAAGFHIGNSLRGLIAARLA